MHNSAEIGQLESINELVELYKKHISSEKLTLAHSYELNILSSIAVQVQNQRKFLISHSAEHFKRFELALAELISIVKTITNTNILKLYKESTIYQVLVNIIFQQGQAKLRKDESDHINYLKDTNSLCIISFHIQSALSQLNGNIKEDTLTIRRILQIIGEYSKSSKNTLNLSNEVIEAIKSKGVSISDFGRIRDKLSHISALFNLQGEIESKDIEKLKKDLESIKYAINEEIYHMQYNFVKALTHKADKICKEENKEVKEKLAEMVKMVDTKEFYKSNIYELARLSERIFRMIDDNKEVKALLSSICIITKKTEKLEVLELDSAFSLPENLGMSVLREIALQDVPADELYENLYEELFKI